MDIDHLQLQTSRLSDLRAFYTDTFDCSVTTVTSDAFTVEIGTTDITFSAVDDGSDPFYHFAINIPQNQFADAVTWLSDRVELLSDAETGEQESFLRTGMLMQSTGSILRTICSNSLPDTIVPTIRTACSKAKTSSE